MVHVRYMVIRGGGYLANSRYFSNISASSKHTLAIVYQVYIWHVKNECDSNNLTDIFEISKILLMEKLTNGNLVTPTPDTHRRNYVCNSCIAVFCCGLILTGITHILQGYSTAIVAEK